MFKKNIQLSWAKAVSISVFVCLLISAIGVDQTSGEPIPPGTAQDMQGSTLLQFTAGGHILGFAPDRVHLAGLDHALTVEFVNGQGKSPLGSAASTASEPGVAHALGRVIYEEMWPGVNVIYTAVESGLVEGSYILQAGADPAEIQLKYNTPVQLLADGTLRFTFETGYMTESAPVAYQDINGKRTPVTVQFILEDGLVGFTVGNSDPGYALTIDPVFAWHTFYGSTEDDKGKAIASDANGNLYVVGTSNTTWNGPGTCITSGISPCPLNAHSGGAEIVVVKLNLAGAYQWHTFFGSTGTDDGLSIASDVGGNIYLTGFSYFAWNGPGSCVTAGISPCPLNAHAGGFEIVVLKLDSAGAYLWHTFYGSANEDYGNYIFRDSGGNIYITGHSRFNWDGPNTVPPLATGYNGIVVLKLDSAGAYQWHTFYGASSDYDSGTSITSDALGNLYVAGISHEPWNGPGSCVTEGVSPCPLHAHAGSGKYDITVLKLGNAGGYQWHTFYGSSVGDDYASSLTTDGSMNLYMVGQSELPWDGPGGVAALNGYTMNSDIVALKLDSAGAYQWHTFYGSTGNDRGTSIVIAGNGNLYLLGTSPFTWNGPGSCVTTGIPPCPLNAYAGAFDFVVLNLDSAGNYQWHAFYGTAGDDTGYGISGNFHIVGTSTGTWSGPGGIAPLNPYTMGSGGDITVIKFKHVNISNSVGNDDGWILESTETGNIGKTMNSTLTTLRLGDDAAKKQYRSLLSFATGAELPDGAVITKVTLKVRRQGIIGGGNPVTTFQGFMLDIRKGAFGISALQLTDWQTVASKTYGPFTPALSGGWYTFDLTSAKTYINKLTSYAGLTQIRLRFSLDDNNNTIANYLSLYSGNAALASRPQLIVEYYVP